ncbi:MULTISPECIES: dihydrolipoyl dehydrogenase [Haloferacaceae]|jgi:dihydrolipoamide dehydrogenase|uniref:Dihydrolipoyl dehydrogenase n=1 Tax=Halorubrum lacusprofundi (strain ATCC 49239 / DSM 5036 / JCM 8891 / ACAM 34) TaxID=416348 RepID=B9LWE8_HALLT|nr:dihydrolipoyl dehydrogenase [Halorubrum lacusprofundi]ACM58538.1 dihydrolipoamide dehydrogenase [Halorubrum lacusprofundi ATCC 49239]AEN04821.1 dihydrolipoamide dehydrogenase [halophilic archaeon DL31]MCG1008204.1 dihydrolipoyl dehydrogenase [Halorubrum lacusprofundi]
MTNTDYDLIVLGGGMAGLPVAMKCGYSGMDVALVEEGLLGGTCLNRGCIPTKTMLRSAEVANLARRSEEFGIDIDGAIEPDIDAIVERKDDIVESIRKGAYENVESNENIDFVEGHGIFESPHEIRVDDRTLSAETIVINTGARPTRPSIDGLDDVDVHDSTDLLERASIPPSLAVIGGGYVGCEYAQMYSRFGADVTVFQRGDTLLPDEDPDVSEVIETAFENEEITVQTGTPVTALTETNDGIRVDAGADGTVSVTASDVALAAGRTPNTDGLQLEDIGASLDENGFVETDDSFRTTADGVYAIGDVSGPPMFTHSARDDADLLYRHLAKSEEISTKGRTVPWAVFTDPQIGHVGLTEQEAREAGYEVGVGRQDFADQGKPKALGETEGFVKLVTNAETDELLGAHIVGEQGAEIVHELVLAIELGATADDIANTMHIHPTLPESINSAAGGVHKPS